MKTSRGVRVRCSDCGGSIVFYPNHRPTCFCDLCLENPEKDLGPWLKMGSQQAAALKMARKEFGMKKGMTPRVVRRALEILEAEGHRLAASELRRECFPKQPQTARD